ncbi:MAG: amino acid adenylation domain-containing protein [Gemmatimonadetes bacterium]|nr:amino acid adenylation domain-containing protein [Gemmatimonadota bacterium]
MTATPLHRLVLDAAARFGERTALVEPGQGRVSYAELDAATARVRDRLVAHGVRPGDRVALCLPKTIDAVVVLLGIMRSGAAYVPIDVGSPAWRAAFVMADCSVRCAFVDAAVHDAIAAELVTRSSAPALFALEAPGGGGAIAAWCDATDAAVTEDAPDDTERLAYLLYTSGSTGTPKGVMITHRAAFAFVDWCSRQFAPSEADRFSSHAPFHFDLSVFDLYVALRHGASVTLLGEELGKEPQRLASVIADERLTVWYSTPSILAMLARHGRLERVDCSALRLVLFAGEVFPIAGLRSIMAAWPTPAYHNLYGPTETNVCTAFPIPAVVPESRTDPYPIGWACDHYEARVADEAGRAVPAGTMGELLMRGPGVMEGYWHLPERTAAAFVEVEGARWYRTGDLVVEEANGCFTFHGRADRMVKRRGYRIELGEVEAAMLRHPSVRDAAVVAHTDADAGTRIVAFLTPRADDRPSLLVLKQFAIEVLPRYMAPDAYTWLEQIPLTSTDKTDYQALRQRVAG